MRTLIALAMVIMTVVIGGGCANHAVDLESSEVPRGSVDLESEEGAARDIEFVLDGAPLSRPFPEQANVTLINTSDNVSYDVGGRISLQEYDADVWKFVYPDPYALVEKYNTLGYDSVDGKYDLDSAASHKLEPGDKLELAFDFALYGDKIDDGIYRFVLGSDVDKTAFEFVVDDAGLTLR